MCTSCSIMVVQIFSKSAPPVLVKACFREYFNTKLACQRLTDYYQKGEMCGFLQCIKYRIRIFVNLHVKLICRLLTGHMLLPVLSLSIYAHKYQTAIITYLKLSLDMLKYGPNDLSTGLKINLKNIYLNTYLKY